MPQYQSQLGQMGLARQSAAGAAATLATAAPTRWAKLRSSSVGAERDLMIPDPEIQGAGGRDIGRTYMGPVTYAGDYEFYVRSEAIPLIAYGAFGGGGGTPTGSGTAGYVHTINPADTLQYFTIQEQLGNGLDVLQYTDALVNTFHLEASADGYLMGTAGIVARQQTAGVAAGTPAFDNTPLYVGSNIAVTLGGSSFPADSFSFDFNNNIESNHFVLGSNLVDVMTPHRRELTGNVALRPQSNALWRQAVNGTTVAVSPTGLPTVQQMVITATTYEIISGATTAVYTTALTIPEVILKPFKPGASGDDTLTHSIDFQAVKIAASNIATLTFTNGISTAYNA